MVIKHLLKLVSLMGLLAATACSDSGSGGGKNAPTEVDGTYHISPQEHDDGTHTPEGLMILEKGSARTITVHYGATTEVQYAYSVSQNKINISAKSTSRRYNCNGSRVSFSENSQNSVANYKMTNGDLEIEIGGNKKVMKQASESVKSRILALPKCLVE